MLEAVQYVDIIDSCCHTLQSHISGHYFPVTHYNVSELDQEVVEVRGQHCILGLRILVEKRHERGCPSHRTLKGIELTANNFNG